MPGNAGPDPRREMKNSNVDQKPLFLETSELANPSFSSLSLCHFCIGQQRLPARNNSTAVVLTVYTKRRVTTTRRKSVRDTRRSSPTPSQVSEIVIPAAAAVQQFPLSLSSVCVVWRVRERKYYARPLQRSFRWKWRRCLVHTIRGHGYFSLRPFPFRSRSVERKREGEENCDELRVTSLSMRACVYVSGHVSMVTRARHRVYPHPAPNADNVLFVCSNERALHLDSIS